MPSPRLALGVLLLAPLLLGADEGPLPFVGEDGERVELALEPGESAVIAHFWATWCHTCVEELPALAAEAAACEAAGAPVRVVTVNVGEDPETIEAYVREHGFSLPVLRDPDGKVWRAFGRGLPVNVFWTPAGRRSEFGPRDAASWREELAGLGCRATGGRPREAVDAR